MGEAEDAGLTPGLGRYCGGGMATHSWRTLWTEKPGRLQFIGLKKVGNGWNDWAHTHSIWSKIIKKKKKRVDWNGNKIKAYCYLIFFSIVYKEGWINLILNDAIIKVCFILCIIEESSITQINMNIKFIWVFICD